MNAKRACGLAALIAVLFLPGCATQQTSDRADAAKIGQNFIAKRYADFDSSGKTLVVNDRGDNWEVTYELPKEMLGGAPVVLIDKRSKEVVKTYRTQ